MRALVRLIGAGLIWYSLVGSFWSWHVGVLLFVASFLRYEDVLTHLIDDHLRTGEGEARRG